MGTRTFQEKEADNPKLRPDLRDKMLKHPDGPDALTAEEREVGVTKVRYMQFREGERSEALSNAATGWARRRPNPRPFASPLQRGLQ